MLTSAIAKVYHARYAYMIRSRPNRRALTSGSLRRPRKGQTGPTRSQVGCLLASSREPRASRTHEADPEAPITQCAPDRPQRQVAYLRKPALCMHSSEPTRGLEPRTPAVLTFDFEHFPREATRSWFLAARPQREPLPVPHPLLAALGRYRRPATPRGSGLPEPTYASPPDQAKRTRLRRGPQSVNQAVTSRRPRPSRLPSPPP
jgi:hypothetical protein